MHQFSRRQSLALLIASLLIASGETRGQAKRKVSLERGSFSDPNETTAWIAYAVALAAWAEKSGAIDRAPAGIFVPSFEGELEARRSQVQIWKELNEKERKVFVYMDQMTEVQAAGFLGEYVWKFHRQPVWAAEPEGLRLAAFDDWLSKSLAGHQPKTGARLRVGS
jgi:hypothetical protein